MPSMNIRAATKSESKKLQKLNNEIFTDNAQYDPDIIKDWAFTPAGEKYFQELLSDQESVCFVAEDASGKLIGYIAAAPKIFSYRKSKYLEVDNLGVAHEYRSQGIGLLLMNHCKTWAQNQGYQKLFVCSYFKNEKAISFYKKCGFEEIDVSLEMEI